ncbi:MAG: biopolymer transporter ExbD [Cyanobacteria bacterium P01_G01_bin.54]
MHLPDDPETTLEVNLLPLIDVLFVVLIFVILVSLGAARIVGLPVDLPAAETAEAAEAEPLTVTIQADGAIALAQQPVTLADLTTTIQRQYPDRPLILLNADAQVPHGRVVEVLDRLRQLQGVQLAIATAPSITPTPMPENTPAPPPAPAAPSPQPAPPASPSN